MSIVAFARIDQFVEGGGVYGTFIELARPIVVLI
jgi:hypothetical protein